MLKTLINIEQFIISKSRYNKLIKTNTKLQLSLNLFQFNLYDCIFCNKKNFKIICNYDKFLLKQDTVYCKNCGLIQSNPRLTDESLKEFYSKDFYREFYINLINQEKIFKAGKQSKIIFNFTKDVIDYKKSDKVLEIGSHAGYNLIEFKKQKLDVLGIDLSLDARKIAKKYNINVENKKLSDLNKKFKLILLINVLEHFNDPISELLKIKNNMNNESYLFIALPQIKNFSSGMLQQAHCHYFKKNDFLYLLSRCGFKIIKFGTYSKDHMYGIFKIGNLDDKKYYLSVLETKKILLLRYFKLFNIFIRLIIGKLFYKK